MVGGGVNRGGRRAFETRFAEAEEGAVVLHRGECFGSWLKTAQIDQKYSRKKGLKNPFFIL